MKKFKEHASMIMMVTGFIGMIVCAVISGINQIKNPDMTQLRLAMEYPIPLAIGLLFCIILCLGFRLFKSELDTWWKR